MNDNQNSDFNRNRRPAITRRGFPLSVLLAVAGEKDFTSLSEIIERDFAPVNLVRLNNSLELMNIIKDGSYPIHIVILGDDLPGIEDSELLGLLKEYADSFPVLLLVKLLKVDVAATILQVGVRHCLAWQPFESMSRLFPIMLDKVLLEQEERTLLRKIQNSYQANQESLRSILENFDIPILVIDQESQKILHSNRESEKLYGYTIDQLRQLTLSDLRVPKSSVEDSQKPSPIVPLTVYFESHQSCWGEKFQVELRSAWMILSGKKVNVLFVHDVTYDQKVKTALRESELRYRFLFEESPIPLIELDWSGIKHSLDALKATIDIPLQNYLTDHPQVMETFLEEMFLKYTNHPVYDLLLVNDRETLNKNLATVIPPESYPIFYAVFNDLYTGKRRISGEIKLRTMELDNRDIIYHLAIPQEYMDSWSMVIISLTNITSRKQMENDLREREQFLNHIARVSPNMLFQFNYREARAVYANDSVVEMLGYSSAKPDGSNAGTVLINVYPDDLAKLPTHVTRLNASQPGEVVEDEFRVKNRAGEWRTLHIREVVNRRDENGQVIETVGNANDITSLKRVAEKLAKSLEEKEILLREMNHRVKNNMQIITSLLSLQEESVYDPRDLKLLRESQQRVRSISLIHEKLYRSSELMKVNAGVYLRELVGELGAAFSSDSMIKVDVESLDIWINAKEAVACGLIVNELVTNAFKYAFRGKSTGRILVRMDDMGEDQQDCAWINLTVADDGIGMPAEDRQKITKGLGLRLVRIMVEQLNGTLTVQDNQPGTSFHIRYCSSGLLN